MSLASKLTTIFQDLTGKTAAVKATEVANAIQSGIGNVKECGDVAYTKLDDDGYNSFTFDSISADRIFQLPTLADNQGVMLWVHLVRVTETLTLDVSPATDWAIGDIITGQTSTATCVVVAKLTALTYKVKSRVGTYTLGEIIGVTGTAAKLADQGATKPVLTRDSYKVIVTPEGTEKINGYNAVVDITENGGWWAFLGTSTEWRGITDGNSTVYKTEATATQNLTTTSNTWEDILTLTIANAGIYDIESEICHYVVNTNVSQYMDLYFGIGVTTGNVEPSLTEIVDEVYNTANALTSRISTQITKKERLTIAAGTILRMKSKYVSNEAATTHQVYCGATIYPYYIQAKRIA